MIFILMVSGCDRAKKTSDPKWIPSNCDSLPNIDFDTQQILTELEIRNKDSLLHKYWANEYTHQKNELHQFINGTSLLFPYQPVDSALFYFYEPASKDDAHLNLAQRTIKDISLICPEKTQLLLNVINNPLNFGIGECGTSIPFAKITLFSQGEEIGEITFGCQYSMISTTPESPMITGTLNAQGLRQLESIQIWN